MWKALVLVLVICSQSLAVVEQVRITLTKNPQEMMVSWVTPTVGNPSVVQLGTTTGTYTAQFTSTNASTYTLGAYTSGEIHFVLVNGLLPATKYFYVCGSGPGGDNALEYSFTTQAATPVPVSLALIGDIGQTQNSQLVARTLTADPNVNLVLLVGDLSYANGDQPKWDTFGRIYEYSTATIPWMVLPGNHENEEYYNPGFGFIAYQARFSLPSGSTNPALKNLFYSFDYSWGHFVALSTESPFGVGSEQYNWFINDMANVNRTNTPWLYVMFHRPYYNTNFAHQFEVLDFRPTYEPLFQQYCVDIVLCGHVHAYERMNPVFNDQVGVNFPVYFNIGDAGNQEGIVYNYFGPTVWSAFHKAEYGYSRHDMFNQTHVHHQWFADQYEYAAFYTDNIVQSPVENRVPKDDVWVIKSFPRAACTA